MKIGLILVIGLITLSCSFRKESDKTDSLGIAQPETATVHHSRDSVILIENDDFDYEKAIRIESYLVTDVDSKETTEIKSKCAVYVLPDHKTLEAMQKKYGQDYYTIADDANWYYSESSRLLDSLGVTQENIKTRYVNCIVNGTPLTIDLLAPTGLYWNLFFFNPNKKPRVMSMAGLWSDTVRAYFDLPARP